MATLPVYEDWTDRPPAGTRLGSGPVAANIEDFYAFSENAGKKTVTAKGSFRTIATGQSLTPNGLKLNSNTVNGDQLQLFSNENIKFIQLGLADDPPDDIAVPALGGSGGSTAYRAVASRYYASWPNYYGTILSISASGFWLSEWAGSALACRARYVGPIKAGDSIGVYAGGAGKYIIHLYLNGVCVSTNNATDKCYHAPTEFIGNGPGTGNCYAYRGTLSYVAIARVDPAFGLAAALHQNPWQVFEPEIVWVPVLAGPGETSLTIASGTQGHTAAGLTLSQIHLLSILNANQGHAAAVATLSVAGTAVLDIANGLQGHTAANLTLSQVHLIAIAGTTQAHVAGALTLAQIHKLTSQNTTQGHTASQATLQGFVSLLINGASQAHAASVPTLSQAHLLAIQNAIQPVIAANASLGQNHTLILSDALHSHLAQNANIFQGLIATPDSRVIMVKVPGAADEPDRVLIVATEERTWKIQ